MANQIVIIKNITTYTKTLLGKDLLPNEEITLTYDLQQQWKESEEVLKAISENEIAVNDGTKDLPPGEGWKWLQGNSGFPISEVGGKVWVHSSTKPVIDGKTFYIQWAGAGDDLQNSIIGDGEPAAVQCTPGTPISQSDFKFDGEFGDVYTHEGYMIWDNAKPGDYVTALIMAEGTLLQTFINLDLVVDQDGYVSYSTGGPGTGTHGFAATPKLLSRSFSNDGDWSYSPSTGLLPSFNKTGNYNISIHQQPVHRFMNKLPVFGSNFHPVRLVSEDCFFLPPGYFLRIQCHNKSNTEWTAGFMITIYRERTFQP